jgi:hypothetical protein
VQRISLDPRSKRPVDRSLRSSGEKMRRRREDPSYQPCHHHRALGVRVCKAWESFEAFSSRAVASGFEPGRLAATIGAGSRGAA